MEDVIEAAAAVRNHTIDILDDLSMFLSQHYTSALVMSPNTSRTFG